MPSPAAPSPGVASRITAETNAMHVFSCQIRDVLVIGEEARIEVLEVDGNRVRLGITSPHQVPEYQEQVVCLGDDEDSEPSAWTMTDRLDDDSAEATPRRCRLVEV